MITLFRIATFVSAMFSTILAVYLFSKRDRSPSLRFLSGLMVANMVYATSYLFEISAPVLSEVIFFLNMEYVGITFIPLFWILIAWSYHPGKTKINHGQLNHLRWFYLLPFAMIVFVWTNRWHHLMYHKISMEIQPPITLLQVERAIGFWIINGILLLFFVIGTVRMLANLIRAPRGYRRQYVLLFLASIPPFISYLLVLTLSVPLHLDMNPIAFALSGLLIFWGIKSMQLFNLVPIAEHMVVDAMHDAMIVLDTNGCLIESNRKARTLFGKDASSFMGIPIEELHPELAKIFTSMDATTDGEITILGTGERRTYTVSYSPITNRRSQVNGFLLLLHDVTEIRSYVLNLERIASSDGLTHLLNHRHFMKQAEQEAVRLQQQGSGSFSLVMFDLDHFKTINDSFGHIAGDMVLQQIGRLITSQARKQDLCARYGGEEFIILLVDTPLDEACTWAQRFCTTLRDTPFSHDQHQLKITASFGVSSFNPEDGIKWDTVLNQADTALYQAKDAGRDQVICFSNSK
jgi:diguanylate cyclase (GGDEF)-like protein/PAS domain S-box-containing protein